jgi:polysaccharide export outer membrane protein
MLGFSNSGCVLRTEGTTVNSRFSTSGKPIQVLVILLGSLLVGCVRSSSPPVPTAAEPATDTNYEYTIGPGDKLNVFVWRNPDVSVTDIPVRPDGRISSPLVEEMVAAGKSPSQLARDIEKRLADYIKEPFVTVTVVDFVGAASEQVRVVGEATTPQAIPYRSSMTLLDVMIAVGGLTEFAAGNKGSIVRSSAGKQQQIAVRIEDLIKDGDISANVPMYPGDIVIIPESPF